MFDVKDINNNAPRFTDCSSYNPTVLEKDNVGTFVIQARHADFGSSLIKSLLSPPKEVMFYTTFVCLSVCFTSFTEASIVEDTAGVSKHITSTISNTQLAFSSFRLQFS